MTRRRAWALVAGGAAVALIAAAFAERPRGDNLLYGPLGVAMLFAGPMLILVGLTSRATAFERRHRPESGARASWSARLRMMGWPFVLIGVAVIPWIIGGLIGAERVEGASCGEDLCGLGSMILVIFGGAVVFGGFGIGFFLFVCSGIASGGIPLTEPQAGESATRVN